MSFAEPSPDAGFLLAVTARRTPGAPALVHLGDDGGLRTVSYAELEQRTAALARRLLALGMHPGERVALLLPADVPCVTLLFAIVRAGLVAVPVSARIPESTIPELLGAIGCRRLLCASGIARDGWEGLEVIEAQRLLRDAEGAGVEPPPFDPAGDATVVFTSGSSGRPKAALHSYANHWFSAAGSNRNIPVGPGDRWLLSLPLWHVGGLGILFRALLGGGAVAVPEPGQPLAHAIEELGATHLSLVPTQLRRLLREAGGGAILTRLKAVLLGGGPLPPDLVRQASQRHIPVFSSYGCTELSSQVTTTAPGDLEERLMTSGRCLPYREVAIAPDGEILARGETLFRGYLERGAVSPARDPEGWFHTGDLGRLDGEGYLSVTGRRDAMFVSGGENIQPEEIERELLRYPGIEDAVVVPMDDAEFGARPAAFLRVTGGVLPERGDVDAFLRKTLPGFKVPVRYLPLPEDGGMKPSRALLRARLAAEASPDCERRS